MDGDSDSRLWSRLAKYIPFKNANSVEKAIQEAQDEGELEAAESSMLLNVLALDDLQVEEIMVPRTDISCMDITSSPGEVIEVIIETGHSRIPIYEGTRDNIIGVAYAKDLLSYLYKPEKQNSPLHEIIRKCYFVPETKKVSDLLQALRARKLLMAIAVDEYGGTSGLITIEDILEQIVGEIEDEYDIPKQHDIHKVNDSTYILSGRTPLEDVAQTLKTVLESEQVETIGGYLSEIAGQVPQAGESFLIREFRYTVTEADAKQIRQIKVEHCDSSLELVPTLAAPAPS